MAKTEYNEVNNVGVLPAYDMESMRVYPRRPSGRTQLVATHTVQNATTTLYTVPASTTLFLTHVNVSFFNAGAASQLGSFVLFSGAAATVFNFGNVAVLPGDSKLVSIDFPVPFEIPATYYFSSYSAAALMFTVPTILGFY